MIEKKGAAFLLCVLGLLIVFYKETHICVTSDGEARNENENLNLALPASHYEIGFTDPINKHLIEHVRLNWIYPPNSDNPKMVEAPIGHDFSQKGQSIIIDKLLKGKTNGFFIECGAFDGKTYSNTLYFERFRNWTGLLIEPGKRTFQKLLMFRRKAYAANVLVCPDNSTNKILFADFRGTGLSGMKEHVQLNSRAINASYKYLVQCFTLETLLKAVGVTKVDYFSLDVEGVELEILRTIPFDKIYIKTLTVEYMFFDGKSRNEDKSQENLNKIRNFFKGLGVYREVEVIELDVIFERID